MHELGWLRVVRSSAGTALLLALSACNVPLARQAAPVALGGGGPETWIDAPLDKMHLPLAPYEVVFHGSSEAAITQMELQINDQPAALPPRSEASQNLVTMKFVWVPVAPGEYVLRARSQEAGGAWSNEAQVTVWVGEGTPTPTETPTPLTITPTRTPTSTPTLPSAGELSFSPRISGQEMYYGGCSPASIDFEVTVAGANIDSVVLFLKLNDQSGAGTTGWMAYDSMRSVGDGAYQISVRADSIEGHDTYLSAWVSYQFVATLRGTVVGRSPSMSDVVLGACGAPPPVLPFIRPPSIFIVPSITPQIIK